MDLVPLKVKIGLKPNGHAKYPNFNSLPIIVASGIDWAQYVDTYGLGWHYDQTSGHKDETADSPFGMQWGLLFVPKAFADQAVASYPLDCTKLNEAQAETFYNTKAHVYEPDEDIQNDVLDGILKKQQLNIPLTPQQLKALDPNDDTPGIRKNKKKTWATFKASLGVKIVQ